MAMSVPLGLRACGTHSAFLLLRTAMTSTSESVRLKRNMFKIKQR